MPHVPGSRASCSNVAVRFPTACSFFPLCFEVSLMSQVPEENGQTFWPIRKIISPPPLLQIKTKNQPQTQNPFFFPLLVSFAEYLIMGSVRGKFVK